MRPPVASQPTCTGSSRPPITGPANKPAQIPQQQSGLMAKLPSQDRFGSRQEQPGKPSQKAGMWTASVSACLVIRLRTCRHA